MERTSETFCNSTSTHYYSAAQEFPKTIYIFCCVVIAIISVSSTVGNIVIILALRKCQSLHPPSKALLSTLALTDLFVGLVVLPLFIAYYLMIILEMPTYYCALAVTYGRTSTFIGTVSLETITTIAVDRFLAFRLLLRYRDVVTLRRVIYILVVEWILSALFTGSWFWNLKFSTVCGIIGLMGCCLITSICYVKIRHGLRRHVAQIRQQRDVTEPTEDFNVVQYKKTVNNMLWISGLLLVCYLPYVASLLAIFAVGLNNSTRFALHFSAIAIYCNSSLNPILYCWKIKELREKVVTLLIKRFYFLTSY